MSAKASESLLQRLGKSLEAEGDKIASKVKAIVVFKIDAEEWTLDLRQDREGDEGPRLLKGPPSSYTADVTMTCTDANFVALCMGKLKPQQAFLLQKLKIDGSMAVALKLPTILDAARPRPKL